MTDSHADGDRLERRRFVVVCAAVLLLSTALKLPSWFGDRGEEDERVYWQLAANWLETGHYSLRGTAILPTLPPGIYDRPLFHHPPLFPALLTPFVAADGPRAAILVSWFGHAAAVAGVALVVWAWRRRDETVLRFTTWLPVLAVGLDPILLFCSRKLWIDDLAGGLTALAFGLLALAGSRRARTDCGEDRARAGSPALDAQRQGSSTPARWIAAGGLALGLAALAKLTALIALPGAWLMLRTGASGSNNAPPVRGETASRRPASHVHETAVLLAPVVLLVLPWLAVFHAEYGVLLPDWTRPDAALIAQSPLVQRAVTRPWHYYLTETALVAPVIVVVVLGYLAQAAPLFRPRREPQQATASPQGVSASRAARPLREASRVLGPGPHAVGAPGSANSPARVARRVAPLVWAAGVVAVLTYLGLRGQGMQLRFLTVAMPAVYAMLAALLAGAERGRLWWATAALMAVVFGAFNVGFYFEPGALRFDEIVPMPRMMWELWGRGV